MNQLFNPVNYFEFQAFEGLPRWQPPAFTGASGFHPISSLTFPIVPGNKKAAEAFLRAAAFD